jgi:hypothetical protein
LILYRLLKTRHHGKNRQKINKNMKTTVAALLILTLLAGCTEDHNTNYRNNPDPLQQNTYIKLPLGSVKPAGWLYDQLRAQADGLTGHLDEFWPDLVNSAWKGGPGEAWERGPYYLDGLVPLAYQLGDTNLIAKSNAWIEKIIESSTESGWFGPTKNKDRWPLAVAGKVLMQYYEATADKRAIDVLMKYFRYLHDTVPDWPDKEWRGVRAMENAVTGLWLYRQTGEKWLPEVIKSIQENSYDWTSYYEKFPWDSSAWSEKRIPLNWGPEGLTAHVVNNAMAIKYPGLWWEQSGDNRFMAAVTDGINKYDIHHGQTGGRFSGDEHLSGNTPDRGTELCSVVEYMYSLETLYEITGDNSLADRLELLAYNSLPGTITADMWAHQYDQQSNQVLVSDAPRGWSTNRNQSNIYGFRPNFACCLANMHQGWPKFVASMWMATRDNGLVAVAYGPSVAEALVGKGKKVTIKQETEYPFRGAIVMTVSTGSPVKFPLYLRVPGWEGFKVSYKGKEINGKAGSTVKLLERWEDGDRIEITFPFGIRIEKRYNNSVSVLRGPLYFSTRIEKEYKQVKLDYDNHSYLGSTDWEIRPLKDWNYSLIIDTLNPSRAFIEEEYPLTRYPWADRGDMVWWADSLRYTEWPFDAPVILRGRGFRVPGWELVNNSAGLPPLSPVKPAGSPEEIILVPYGAAKLRLTEIPMADIVFMEPVINR